MGVAAIEPFDWNGSAPHAAFEPLPAHTGRGAAGAPQPVEPPSPTPSPAEDPTFQARLASLEREAFAKGYEQGERAGVEAGSTRAEAMLRRLAQTIEELADLRRTMIRQTERQMVQLSLAVAKRILRREVVVDRELTLTMARVALERLGDATAVTIRLNPADFEATFRRHDDLQTHTGARVSVVADPAISRGGCLVQSDFGYVDGSVDAQFQELARALLVDEGQEVPLASHAG
jgi:flagellar assembly protein FliH